MGFFLGQKEKKKLTAALFEAVISGDEVAVRQALRPGVDINALDADGLTLLRHAIRQKKLAVMGLLLGGGAKPTPECAGAVAHWVARADRARRFEHANHRNELLRVKTAVRLMNQYDTPWDTPVKSISSGDTPRTAIVHLLPGCFTLQGQ